MGVASSAILILSLRPCRTRGKEEAGIHEWYLVRVIYQKRLRLTVEKADTIEKSNGLEGGSAIELEFPSQADGAEENPKHTNNPAF